MAMCPVPSALATIRGLADHLAPGSSLAALSWRGDVQKMFLQPLQLLLPSLGSSLPGFPSSHRDDLVRPWCPCRPS